MVKWPPKLPENSPLTLHPNGYQARIAGKTRWIAGKVTPTEAMARYHKKAAVLLAKTKAIPEPIRRGPSARVTMFDVVNHWAFNRRTAAEQGDITSGTFGEYRRSAKRLGDEVGHWLIDDWGPPQTEALHAALKEKFGVDAARRAINHLSIACAHADDSEFIDRPIRLGKIARKLAARPKTSMHWTLYTPEQIRVILAAAHAITSAKSGIVRTAAEQMHAMILLALNGGYGAMELAQLTREGVNLDTALIDHNRGKTGVQHMVTLWPETVDALRKVFAQRPGDALVFRTREGNPWCRVTPIVGKGGKLVNGSRQDNVGWRFDKLVRSLNLKVPNQGFYKLRHLASTTADDFGDAHATFAWCGHALPGVKSHYVLVSLERIRALTDYLRERLLNSRVAPR